jgi:hypothetical protein
LIAFTHLQGTLGRHASLKLRQTTQVSAVEIDELRALSISDAVG